MPSRNVLKVDTPDSYYHVYARGNSRNEIFLDEQDYAALINLFKRYLSVEQQHDRNGVPYPHLYTKLELLCYCIMQNHLHLLVYQKDIGAMAQLMRGVMTSYSRYFNKRYDRSGALFESRYKASSIDTHSYLEHITRYIHLNPKEWKTYQYSSLPYYCNERRAEWLLPQKILDQFSTSAEYLTFVKDYEANKVMLEEIKHELANAKDI